MNRNITEHTGVVSAEERERILGQRGCVIWLTGLSGSGKSTIASALEARLVGEGRLAVVLDGDNLRHGLNTDLGFSAADRAENVRRVGEVAALFAQAGLIAITSLISPSREGRERARASARNGRFIEVFVDAPLSQCEARDPKGLYRRARAGEIPEFTGISAPYEAPLRPELIIRSAEQGVREAVESIHALLKERHYLDSPATEGPTA